MATETTKPEQDPAEGSREVVDRELKRDAAKKAGQEEADKPEKAPNPR